MENYDFYIKKQVPNHERDFRPPDYYSHQENPFVQDRRVNWLYMFHEDPEMTLTTILFLTYFIPSKGYTWATNEIISSYLNKSERQVRRIISTLRQKKIIFSVGIRYDLVVLRRLMLYTEENYETAKYL